MNNDFLVFDHVTKRFGALTAVNDVCLTVNKGEFFSLLGPSGCGKTTLLRMLGGFERPDSGRIYLEGKDITDLPPNQRRVHTVFQNYALFPTMTIWDNIAFSLKLAKKPKAEIEERVDEILEMIQLSDQAWKYPNQLSGGQKQRVAIARALVDRPQVLLLDEPLSNLDAKLRESMRFEISAIQKKLGITVIYVTHDQSEAMTMSDRIVVMSMGVVQQIGTPYDIYTRPANKMVADFVGLINFIPGEQRGDRAFIRGTNFSVPYEGTPKDELQIAVRPENITMSVNGGAIAGTIEEYFYLGDSVDYRVLVGDTIIRVIEKGAELGALKIGDKVYLDMDKVMVF